MADMGRVGKGKGSDAWLDKDLVVVMEKKAAAEAADRFQELVERVSGSLGPLAASAETALSDIMASMSETRCPELQVPSDASPLPPIGNDLGDDGYLDLLRAASGTRLGGMIGMMLSKGGADFEGRGGFGLERAIGRMDPRDMFRHMPPAWEMRRHVLLEVLEGAGARDFANCGLPMDRVAEVLGLNALPTERQQSALMVLKVSMEGGSFSEELASDAAGLAAEGGLGGGFPELMARLMDADMAAGFLYKKATGKLPENLPAWGVAILDEASSRVLATFPDKVVSRFKARVDKSRAREARKAQEGHAKVLGDAAVATKDAVVLALTEDDWEFVAGLSVARARGRLVGRLPGSDGNEWLCSDGEGARNVVSVRIEGGGSGEVLAKEAPKSQRAALAAHPSVFGATPSRARFGQVEQTPVLGLAGGVLGLLALCVMDGAFARCVVDGIRSQGSGSGYFDIEGGLRAEKVPAGLFSKFGDMSDVHRLRLVSKAFGFSEDSKGLAIEGMMPVLLEMEEGWRRATVKMFGGSKAVEAAVGCGINVLGALDRVAGAERVAVENPALFRLGMGLMMGGGKVRPNDSMASDVADVLSKAGLGKAGWKVVSKSPDLMSRLGRMGVEGAGEGLLPVVCSLVNEAAEFSDEKRASLVSAATSLCDEGGAVVDRAARADLLALAELCADRPISLKAKNIAEMRKALEREEAKRNGRRRILREAAEVANSSGWVDTAGQWRLVSDWAQGDKRGFEQATGSSSCSWRSLMERQAAWHRAQLERMMASRIGGWTPLLDEELSEDGKFRALELCSAQALHEEGQAMRHCVGSYAKRCATGSSAVFSVQGKRSDGTWRREGTLELSRSGSTWSFSQYRGPCNARVDGLSVEFAQLLQERATQAQEKMDGEKERGEGVRDEGGDAAFATRSGSLSMGILGGRR